MAAFNNGIPDRRYLVPFLSVKGMCVKNEQRRLQKQKKLAEYSKKIPGTMKGKGHVSLFIWRDGKGRFIKNGTSPFWFFKVTK